MTTTTTTVSPFVVGELTEVELADAKGNKKKFWKKQILPSGTRKYKGQELDFSKINPACVKAFDEKAFDAVPFVLAMSDNSHPGTGDEAKQLEGDLAKLELASDGSLFGYFDLSNSATAVDAIKKSNGKFGVSGRIEVDYEAGDTGKKFDYALSHVCGTTRPHIKGLAGWEPVDLSEEEKTREVIDFSTEVIEVEAPTNTDPTNKETGDDLVALEIPKDQFDKLMKFIGEVDAAEEAAKNQLGGEGGDSKTAPTELSEDAQKRIALAEEQAKKAFEFAERTQVSAAAQTWATRKTQLVNDGVPPVMVDLAETVLKRHKHVTLDFSDTDKVDATEVIEKMLEAAKGTIKLSQEEGHSFGDKVTVDKEYADLEASFTAYWDR